MSGDTQDDDSSKGPPAAELSDPVPIENAAFLRSVLEALPCFVVQLDPDRCIRYINRLRSGVTPSQVIGRPYSIGAMAGTPGGVTIQFDFEGTQISSGPVTVPPSPTPQTEAYHEWYASENIGQVTFPQAGMYLMRFTLTEQQFNPLFFTFTKM